MTETIEFRPFAKMARLSREMIITEKIDGRNASVLITEEGQIMAASRTRWITPTDDNFGFAKWVEANKDDLLKLGAGHHFGEWWGNGIQRGYGLLKGEKRFSLFNTSRWSDSSVRPRCCGVVPILCEDVFDTEIISSCLDHLKEHGSSIVPGFMNPEGIVVFHTAANFCFKKTIEHDDMPKSLVK